MRTTDTLILGGGQAGLALSRCLTALGRDHLVIERGRTAERWHSERWDSLRLLTPNWMTRLPYLSFRGKDPDGFLPARQVDAFLRGYASSFDAPVIENAAVISVRRPDERYRVETASGMWAADHVVVATGHAAIPIVATFGRDLASDIT